MMRIWRRAWVRTWWRSCRLLVYLLKIVLFIFFFMWVRWTIPRFRYDQLMKLGWKVLIPLAIFNMLVTGFVVLLKPNHWHF